MLALPERVSALLKDHNGAPWFPQLTDDLAAMGWDKLASEIGVGPHNYGTSRIICKNNAEAVEVVTYVKVHASIDGPVVPIHTVPEALIGPYCTSEFKLYSGQQLLGSTILSCVQDAFDLIGQVPSLMKTVVVLVRALHLIKPVDASHDVSFSEPGLPFSVFVSVPERRVANDALRLAEAIIHEAMHLQLTLIERVVALCHSSKQRYFSPWREEFRDSQGLLHALYVFRVVDCFFENLLGDSSVPVESNHIANRRREIEKQIQRVESFQFSADLTPLGVCFVRALCFPYLGVLNRSSCYEVLGH